MKVLVLDIGGSNVKLRVTGQAAVTKFPTGPRYTPERLLADLTAVTGDWDHDVVSVGFPAPVVAGGIPREPQNLGCGWVGFRFEEALGRPVKLINDAAMQAVGCYQGGTMLFMSLGTGLGSALIADYQVLALELCELRWSRQATLEDQLGKAAVKRLGRARWETSVHAAAAMLRDAFVVDEVVIGGGGAKHLKHLPAWARRAHNRDALTGGEVLWTEARFRT